MSKAKLSEEIETLMHWFKDTADDMALTQNVPDWDSETIESQIEFYKWASNVLKKVVRSMNS
jgi:hypothetical protein